MTRTLHTGFHKRCRIELLCIGLVLLLAARAFPQGPSKLGLEVDAIDCWWRSTVAAVRVGQPFNVVLTCSVLDAQPVKAVPDESSLSPNTIQMSPFEVLGGNKSADLASPDRRFFQYVYNLRLISPDFFGKDARIPELKITYRIQRQESSGTAAQGIENSYILPNLPIRVLSLVPTEAHDIRDASSETFEQIESRSFLADSLIASGIILIVIAGIILVAAIARSIASRRSTQSVQHQIPDFAILQIVLNEFSAIDTQRQLGGSTVDLTSRLLTALRIAATFAVKGTLVRLIPSSNEPVGDGYLRVCYRPHVLARRLVAHVPASLTSSALAQVRVRMNSSLPANRLDMLEELERGIASLTAMEYSQATRNAEDLEFSLQVGIRATQQLYSEQFHPLWNLVGFRRVFAVYR